MFFQNLPLFPGYSALDTAKSGRKSAAKTLSGLNRLPNPTRPSSSPRQSFAGARTYRAGDQPTLLFRDTFGGIPSAVPSLPWKSSPYRPRPQNLSQISLYFRAIPVSSAQKRAKKFTACPQP